MCSPAPAPGYTDRTPTLRFAPFTVDLHRRALMRDGAQVELSPRLVQVLGHLASHPGAVISKSALLDRFWPGIFVTDNTLDRAMARIRRALADNPARPAFIQTVARRGYRFVGPVDASGAPAAGDAFDQWTKGRLWLERLDAGQLDQSVAAFERVLAENTGYAPAHVALANAYFLQYELTRPENAPDRARLEQALTHAHQACVLDPVSGEAWATLGFLLTGAGEVGKARAAARRATSLEPSSWRHFFRLSFACWGEERLHATGRTLSLMPDFAPARLVAAMVFVARQALAAAEELAVEGAALQSQDAGRDSPFPACGLHWLLGLLQLRRGAIADALASFEREVRDARRTSIYVREFRLNAWTAAGYAHLVADDAAAAAGAFRRALEIVPSNGRALLGLQQACTNSGLAADARALAPRVDDSLDQLVSGGRRVEAAVLGAGVEAARGNLAAASAVLERLLEHAPPGQSGWMIPIDPMLGRLRGEPSFARVVGLLSARAG